MIEVRRTDELNSWLKGLRDTAARARIASRLARIEDGNFGDATPVGEGVSELRMHFGPGYRAYYVRQGDVVVILLCGGDKSSQSRDIEKAKAMAKKLKE